MISPLSGRKSSHGLRQLCQKILPKWRNFKENFEQARQSAVNKIEDLSWEYRKLGWQSVLGSSGTIKTVYQVITATLDPNGIITAERLQNLIEQTLQASHFEELNIAGLNSDRVDIFVPGLAILSAVFDVFSLENMRYSDGAYEKE